VASWRGVGVLGLVLVACLLVVPLNPYGLALYGYPLRTVSIGALQDFIQEWQSPNFHMREAQVSIALWLAVLVAAGLSRRRMAVTDFVLVSGSFYMALLAGRNIAFFALLAAPVLARHAQAVLEQARGRWPRLVDALEGQRAPHTPAARALNW